MLLVVSVYHGTLRATFLQLFVLVHQDLSPGRLQDFTSKLLLVHACKQIVWYCSL